jgi:hypothetical protein
MTFDDYGPVLFALCIWREARNQSDIARHGVAWVMMNRLLSHFDGCRTRIEVILQRAQFSSFNPTDPNAHLLPNPRNVVDWAAWLACCSIVDSIDDPTSPPTQADPTSGAIYYESYPEADLPALRLREPCFAVDKLTVQLGAIRFYRA